MRWTLCLLAVLGLVPIAGAYGVSEGPAMVSYGFPNRGTCMPEALSEACLVSYEEGPEPGRSDDTIYQYRGFDGIDVVVDAGEVGQIGYGPPEHHEDVSQDSLTFETGLGQRFSDAADTADAAMPGPYHSLARVWYSQSAFIVDLSTPSPFALVEGRFEQSTLEVPVWLVITNRTSTVAPTGMKPIDSDDVLSLVRETLTGCNFPYEFWGHGICLDLPVNDTMDQANATLPDAVVGAGAWRAGLSLAGHGASPLATFARAGSLGAGSADRSSPWIPSNSDETWWGHTGTMSLAHSEVDLQRPVEKGTPPETHATSQAEQRQTDTWPVIVAAVAILLVPIGLLYSRIHAKACLRHATRARIVDMVGAQPGLLVGEIAATLGLDYQTVKHHVRVLQRAGYVDVARGGRNVAVYRAGHLRAREKSSMINLRRGPQAEMLRLVHRAPGVTVSEAASALGCAKSSAHAKLHRLKHQGLVQQVAKGGFFATSEGLRSLYLVDEVAAPRPP